MAEKSITFVKISATGNDFITIDNRRSRIDAERDRPWLQSICQRRISVGADGVILVQPSQRADFEYVHINSDGSLAEMCGNGSRAVAYFAQQIGAAGPALSFEILGSIYRARVDGRRVTTDFLPPRHLDFEPAVTGLPGLVVAGSIDTGVPHLVVFADNLTDLDVQTAGSFYRHHPAFPRGTNVDFILPVDQHHLCVRTFERGVEQETLACGTGAVASSIIAQRHNKVSPPVICHFAGGDLTIDFTTDFSHLTLTGSVAPIYSGSFID
ncbi:MAG TPA: diaminopimelate epimerase [bacterium]|jgi:diaminopimelate epimerase|nr:diaminopimelate epimerase [bacterium]HOX85003.1 diaminopimelate epimerase [bacterium]HPG44131.1 diaminopimelate epimerase [bacterium]HPM96498.1 diaminopimelate epimerase [bacterium]